MQVFGYLGGKSSRKSVGSWDEAQRQAASVIEPDNTPKGYAQDGNNLESPQGVFMGLVKDEDGLDPAWKNMEWWQASMVMIVSTFSLVVFYMYGIDSSHGMVDPGNRPGRTYRSTPENLSVAAAM